MREIKFRAWDKIEKCFLTNGFSIHASGIFSLGYGLDQTGGGVSFIHEPELHNNDKRFIVCQFTGLLDKNGKEIYEGDLVRMFDEEKMIHEIIFRDGCFGYVSIPNHFVELNNHPFEWVDGKSKCLEVVDNIYENPELGKRSHETF